MFTLADTLPGECNLTREPHCLIRHLSILVEFGVPSLDSPVFSSEHIVVLLNASSLS